LYNTGFAEKKKALESQGFSFSDYTGMMAEMKKGTLVIDDISHYEIEKMIEMYKPDIVCSGIKDKFVIEKMGVPCKQLHSYDYQGPYAAFTGAANFYREIHRAPLAEEQAVSKIVCRRIVGIERFGKFLPDPIPWTKNLIDL
jgi:nitrogenase molybdenum-iron protein alpha/beta subunit